MFRQQFKHIGRHLLIAIFIIFSIAVINFFLLHLAPGDAVDVLASEAGSATPEYITQLREKFGLDQPFYVQLFSYLRNLLILDLGFSFRHDKPVSLLILERLIPTLILMVTTILLAVGGGILLGVVAAMGFNTWRDNLISIFALVSYATPLFWVGLMFILLFSIQLDWLPTSGMETIGAFYEGWERILDIAKHLILPSTSLALYYLALYTRLMRTSMLEQSNMDYVTTARAKGLKESGIAFRHILPSALLPIITMAGVQVGGLIGGSVIVESVFGWPGLGTLAFESLFARDLNLLLGIFFLSSCLVVTANFAMDLIYSFLDPRIDLR